MCSQAPCKSQFFMTVSVAENVLSTGIQCPMPKGHTTLASSNPDLSKHLTCVAQSNENQKHVSMVEGKKRSSCVNHFEIFLLFKKIIECQEWKVCLLGSMGSWREEYLSFHSLPPLSLFSSDENFTESISCLFLPLPHQRTAPQRR